MANFNLTKMAVNMYCPGNSVQLDDAGLPSVMVYIPAFKLSDVISNSITGDNTIPDTTHPAFIVNGKEIPGFYYSKYQNVVHDGKAYSLPAEDPHSFVTFDKAREYCEAKGHGWHISTAAEWAAIALWCQKNGFFPNGNNKYGKDIGESKENAIPAMKSGDGKTQHVATGTGPLTWSHDRTPSGIWDLNGNVCEWQGGLRIVWGELQILANNDAADPDNPQNNTSTCWRAIDASTGRLVDPESKVSDTSSKTSGNTVKLDWINETWNFTTGISNQQSSLKGCDMSNMKTDAISEAAKLILVALAIYPDDFTGLNTYNYNNSVFFKNSSPESMLYRGGSWSNGANSGVFALSCDNIRNAKSTSIGFRAAYIPEL